MIVAVKPDQPVSFTQQIQDGNLTVDIPIGAVSETVELHYSTLITPTPALVGFRFAGYTFALDAYLSNIKQEKFAFQQPVTLTIAYTDNMPTNLDENQLVLYYYDRESEQWTENGITILGRDLDNNRIIARIEHLSLFTLFAPEIPTSNPLYYLPLMVGKNAD